MLSFAGFFKLTFFFFPSRIGKPGTPEVLLEDDSAHLSWSAPRDDGRSPVFDYIIEYKQAGDMRWKSVNSGSKATNYTVSGLQPDREYEFRVSAENKAGVGSPSGNSRTVQYGKY